MANELKDIEPDEISLVDFAATRKKFLIIKNGKDTHKSLALQGDFGIAIKKRTKQMKELRKLFEDYFGDDFKKEEFEKFEKAEIKTEDLKILKDALGIINKYKNDFPNDLKNAIGVFAKSSIQEDEKTTEEVKTDTDFKEALEKAGATLSKSTMVKLNQAIEILSKLAGIEPKQKSDTEMIKDEIAALKKSIEDAGKEEEENEIVKQNKTIEDLKKRLETVEKSKGVKKSIDNEGGNESSEFKWTSFDQLEGV